MSGAIRLLPLYAFMVWTWPTLPLLSSVNYHSSNSSIFIHLPITAWKIDPLVCSSKSSPPTHSIQKPGRALIPATPSFFVPLPATPHSQPPALKCSILYWLLHLKFEYEIEICKTRGSKIFHKSSSRLQILGARRVTYSTLHTEDTQILGATVQTYSKYHLYYRHQTSVIPVTAV